MAVWNSVEAIVSGFGANETDFEARIQALDATQQAQMIGLVDRIATVTTDASAKAVVLVQGHSDRQDLVGLTAEQRRASELEASTNRVASAGNWLVDRLTERLGPPDADAVWPQVLILRVACGAASLVHPTPTEAQRLDNRRVILSLRTFNMPAFPEDLELLDLG